VSAANERRSGNRKVVASGRPAFDPRAEWLEADGLGGFASGTVNDIRTRRYHALLLHATAPPAGRCLLVNGVEAWLEHAGTHSALTSQCYAGNVVSGDGAAHIVAFEHEPWPRWTLELPNGVRVTYERFVRHGLPLVVLRWCVEGALPGTTLPGTTLCVRPLLSGRDPHALQHANDAFRFEPERLGAAIAWRPYDGVPGVLALADADYEHAPDWYWHFLYEEERARGLDDEEDLASPGVFRWDLSRRDAVLVLASDTPATRECLGGEAARDLVVRLTTAERKRRAAFDSPLHRAADSYLVQRGKGRTIIAGYPWFGDWGRDTFIALRGLCLATGRLDDARAILLEWSGAVSEGMLPNRFPDQGDTPEYNSVDGSLWYVVVVGEWLDAMKLAGRRVATVDRARLRCAVEEILEAYERGTRCGIRREPDGLLACGEPGVQLTWMDAKVGDWVVTPRTGKPVEIQALWVNALHVGVRFGKHWVALRDQARAAFEPRFWNESRGCLFDVVDVDHVSGTTDASLRPNQLFAVGGLPLALIKGERARRMLEVCERELLTPMGPRSLAPGEPGYAPHYAGGVRERDGAYHQGTVWPWLMGAFVEAWLRVHGESAATKREARARFLAPLHAHLSTAGLGHVSEIADAESPYTPNGCPFQAWSLGELLRLELAVLAGATRARGTGLAGGRRG
jgi:predicted glycogen debranching enzyme